MAVPDPQTSVFALVAAAMFLDYYGVVRSGP